MFEGEKTVLIAGRVPEPFKAFLLQHYGGITEGLLNLIEKDYKLAQGQPLEVAIDELAFDETVNTAMNVINKKDTLVEKLKFARIWAHIVEEKSGRLITAQTLLEKVGVTMQQVAEVDKAVKASS